MKGKRLVGREGMVSEMVDERREEFGMNQLGNGNV